MSQEARRRDAGFLEGITNRVQWEARRPELRREYFEMLGLWPLPERTPALPVCCKSVPPLQGLGESVPESLGLRAERSTPG